MNGPRAWTFLTIEGERQYGGNEGYDDEPARLYRYDSNVANHRQVKPGDIAIIRTLNVVLGIARVEAVDESNGPKERLCCPVCSTVNVKRRVTMQPAYRCHEGHEFEAPLRQWIEVRKYEAHYGGTFRKVGPNLTVAGLLGAVMRPSDQMSIKEIDLGYLHSQLGSDANIAALIDDFARRLLPPDPEGADVTQAETIIDERRRVLRQIALRRGQRKFRQRLIARYGFACQISGCAFPGLIEAAHISPYARSSDNSARNGLLLRSDLHTLFDLGLLAIDPQTLVVRLRPEVVASGYEALDGQSLETNSTAGPDRAALEARWHLFLGEQTEP